MGERGRALAEREFDRTLLANRWVDTLDNTWPARGGPNIKTTTS